MADIEIMSLAYGSIAPVFPTPEEVAKALRHLPSAPRVLPRLYGQVRGCGSSLHQIGTLLRFDPGLTARVMQLGNSLSASCGDHCFTVEDAINRVGLDEIANLVAAVADGQALARPISIYGLDAEDFWRWSIACALAAEVLAEHTGEDTSVAHTIGLLHAVGMVAVDDWVMRRGPALMFKAAGMPLEFVESEQALLGFTQADVGAALLRSWDFPVTMVEAVRLQYAPCGSTGYARLACLLKAAKWLRSTVCSDELAPPPFPSAAVLQSLHLTTDKLNSLVVELRVRLGEVRNALDRRAA